MNDIPARSDYLNNPHELTKERCYTCDSILVEREFIHLHQTLMVCGNIDCPDCDPKLKAAYLAEKEND